MDFLKAFQEIDTDFSGEITREELQAYMIKNDYKQGLVDKWLEIFDIDDSGTITLEDYCDILGLRVPDGYKQQTSDSTKNGQCDDAIQNNHFGIETNLSDSPHVEEEEDLLQPKDVSKTRSEPIQDSGVAKSNNNHSSADSESANISDIYTGQQQQQQILHDSREWTEQELRSYFIVAQASEIDTQCLLDCLRLARQALCHIELKQKACRFTDSQDSSTPVTCILALTAVARFIKVQLDLLHQPEWHVIVGRRVGKFHASMEHSENSFVVFCDSKKQYGFLVWRTRVEVTAMSEATTEHDSVEAASKTKQRNKLLGSMAGTFDSSLGQVQKDFDPFVCEFQELRFL